LVEDKREKPKYLVFSETDIIKVLDLFIYNIFVMFGRRVILQTVGIPMCTNYAPILADCFLYSYEADLKQEVLKKNENKLARSFNARSAT